MKILSRLFNLKEEITGNSVNDRRHAKRYDIALKLTYSGPLSNCQGEALTKNICSTGIRFPANTKISKGTMLNLKVEDPFSDALISSMAEVIWMDEFVADDGGENLIYEVGVKLLKKRLY